MKWLFVLGVIGASTIFQLAMAKESDNSGNPDDLVTAYMAEYETQVHTAVKRTAKIAFLLHQMEVPWNMTGRQFVEMPPRRRYIVCAACNLIISYFFNQKRRGKTSAELAESMITHCIFLQIQPAEVCRGIINEMMPIFYYIQTQRPDLTPQGLCGIVFQNMNCKTDDKYFEFSVKIDSKHAKPITQSKKATPPSASRPLKIVHITDVHYDPNYEVGANAKCGAPICCRRKQGKPTNAQFGAGHWGDYRDCDMPLETIVGAFDDIRQRHSDLDLIYFTGDVIDHGLWETSVEYNQNVYAVVHQLMVDMFPNTPIYWILGNHEAHPVNEFAPDFVTEANLTSQWIYDMAAEKWSHWLPNYTQPTIRKGGYYTVPIRDGLRLIAINNNDCNIYNFWIMLDPQYLVKQLQWLHDTLLEAEFNEEKVHLLAHIPSGEFDAFKVWVREYRFILDRFWDTIVAQFVGHTHFNTFNVYYSRESPDLAIGQVWNGGSISAYSNLNSNYNVYSIDAESFEVLDAYSYYFNLTAANLTPNQLPQWQQLFSMRDDFALSDLSPASLDRLVVKMAHRPKLRHKHWQHTVKLGDTTLAKGCNNECMRMHICELVNNEVVDKRKCTSLMKGFK